MIVYEFLIPIAKNELTYIADDGEAFENRCYYDIVEHVWYLQLGCHCFKKLFINFFKTVEELVWMFYNSMQDYFDHKSIHNFIYPKHYDVCNANVCHSLY